MYEGNVKGNVLYRLERWMSTCVGRMCRMAYWSAAAAGWAVCPMRRGWEALSDRYLIVPHTDRYRYTRWPTGIVLRLHSFIHWLIGCPRITVDFRWRSCDKKRWSSTWQCWILRTPERVRERVSWVWCAACSTRSRSWRSIAVVQAARLENNT